MASVAKIIDTALRHHQAGRLEKAERAYKKLLVLVPNHSDGLHGLGLIAHQQGNHNRAAELIASSIDVNPKFPLYYMNLSTVLIAKGDLDRAVETLTVAVTEFQHSVKYKPQLGDILGQLGDLCFEMGRLDSASNYLSQAIHLQPDSAINHKKLGHVQIRSGDLDSGISNLWQAVHLQSDFGEAYNMLGRVFHDTGDLEKGRECYQQAIQFQPGLSEPYCNLGNLYLEMSIVETAVHYLHRALQINPNYPEAHVNLGIAKLDQQDFKSAEDQFKQACQLKQEDVDLHGYWSHALLLRGYFAEGWAESECGLTLRRRTVSDVSAPFWDGSPLVGRTVLVLSEQGVGDQIMFLSCVDDLLDKALPETCILECDPRLIPLYSRSFPSIYFQAKQQGTQWLANYPEPDVKIAIGSLPRVFRAREENFPQRAGYLMPDPERVMRWKARFRSLGEGRVIGISWRGGHSEQARRQRSTTLEQWMPVFSTPNTAFVNLQYGDCRQELEAINSEQKLLIHDWPESDPLVDLDDFAAQIAALDLVISIDNCTVHMAGAVGIPVWTLLPYVSDWRWMRYREDSPWYSAMRLFRQPKPGDWEAVFKRISQLLST